MAKKSWGLPYMGSKNSIAKDIVNALPGGERLVDLFAGGCAITDYALKNTNKFSRFLVNDLNGWSPQTYLKALAGGFKDEERWISRKDFFRLKDTDPYVKLCFSFGNGLKTYMYNPELEPYKRALHHIIFWENYGPMEELCPQVVDIIKEYCKGKDRKGRRLASGYAVADHIKQKGSVEYWQSNPMFRSVKVKWSPERRGLKGSEIANNALKDISTKPILQSLENLERLERLESLENLERLERLESLQRLERLESLEILQRLESPKILQSLASLERICSQESLERLQSIVQHDSNIETSSISYADYAYSDGDVVYCDPPYKNTNDYGIRFDSDAFWEWARTRSYPVYVSEYQAPEDFVSIWNKEKRVLLNRESLVAPRTEHIFVHKRFANATP